MKTTSHQATTRRGTLLQTTLLSFALGLPMATHAANQANGQAAIDQLRGSIANAELTLAVVEAEQTISQVRGQEALSQLAASVAGAELAITLADATDAIRNVSDSQMMAELDGLLKKGENSEAMMQAVVQERPELASAVHDSALKAGFNEAQVAAIITTGLGELQGTAAGK